MNREELIAPEQYNLVSEFEKYATGEGKKALDLYQSKGEKKEITYEELMTFIESGGKCIYRKWS